MALADHEAACVADDLAAGVVPHNMFAAAFRTTELLLDDGRRLGGLQG